MKPEPVEEIDDTEGAFQSDMLFTPEQMEELMRLINEGNADEFGKRRATAFLSKRWPQNTLMYEFSPSSGKQSFLSVQFCCRYVEMTRVAEKSNRNLSETYEGEIFVSPVDAKEDPLPRVCQVA